MNEATDVIRQKVCLQLYWSFIFHFQYPTKLTMVFFTKCNIVHNTDIWLDKLITVTKIHLRYFQHDAGFFSLTLAAIIPVPTLPHESMATTIGWTGSSLMFTLNNTIHCQFMSTLFLSSLFFLSHLTVLSTQCSAVSPQETLQITVPGSIHSCWTTTSELYKVHLYGADICMSLWLSWFRWNTTGYILQVSSFTNSI